MAEGSEHKASVRDEFTAQADSYASSSLLTDTDKVERLVDVTGLPPSARVLDVATGPGHVARRFASACDTVIGIDLTKAPLEIAEQNRRDDDIENAHFARGDAESLPFDDDTFDGVVSRLALHHLETPEIALQEMKRVCRPDGTVVADDIVVSEHPERARYQNEFERIRDPSHVRALPLSELIGLLADCDLEITDVRTNTLVQDFGDWIETAQTPEQRATNAREMIERDEQEDLSGTQPFCRDGELRFTQNTAIAVGRPIS